MQKLILYSGISCIIGAALSGLIVWKVTERKYSNLAHDEIESVKAHFTVPRKLSDSDGKKPETTAKSKAEQAKNKPDLPDLAEYTRKLSEGGYTNYSNSALPMVDPVEKCPAHVITPDEFGENEEYDQVSLTLYADGILADEDDNIVEAEETVGTESLNHMGDYEDDAVHVVNPKLKIYYEILEDIRSYKDATHKDPHLQDGEDK